MRAIITGAPIEVEGEPAEIAQLVELMTSGVVKVEHQHRFRLDEPDDNGIQRGACWCGTERTYAPFDADNRKLGGKAPAAGHNSVGGRMEDDGRVVADGVPVKKSRVCKVCGVSGHDVRKCPTAKAAA